MNATLTPSVAPDSQPLPKDFQGVLLYYHYSCQVIVLFGLPVAICGIISTFITTLAMSTNRYAYSHPFLSYIDGISGLFISIGDLLCLRLVLLLPAAIEYNEGNAYEGSPVPFDPIYRAGGSHCIALAFMRHFFNAFRCNLLFVTCCHMGFHELESETIHPFSTFMSVSVSFSIALMSSMPVITITDHWKAWNLTICGFNPRIHPLLLAWANVHCIFFCDSLIVLIIIIIVLGQRVNSLWRQFDATSRYLRNITPKSTFFSMLFDNLAGKMDHSIGKLSHLFYYCRFVATVKLMAVIAKAFIYFSDSKTQEPLLNYVNFCLWESTINNYACLADVILFMFAPLWWYSKSVQLRAAMGWKWCQKRIEEKNKFGLIMPPKELFASEDSPTGVINIMSESNTRKVIKYKELLSKRFTESPPVRPTHSNPPR